MTAFALETYAQVIDDIRPLLFNHWRELALYQDVIPLDPDWTAYQRAEAAGMMKVFTARQGGALVGYTIFFVVPRHMHYAHRWAKNDIVWIMPDLRNGRVSVGLFRYAEKCLREDGPIVVYIETKESHPDLALLLGRLGYNLTGHGFSKRLG